VWKTWIYFQFSACRYPVSPATFSEQAIFSPSYILGTVVKNQVGLAACIHIWVFYSVPLVFVPVFCASTMLFLLLWCYFYYAVFISSIVWIGYCNTSWAALFCSVLPWLFTVCYASMWTSGLILQFLWWMSLEFWWGMHWTNRLFLLTEPFSQYWFS
jgi:hypothetical protein